MKTIKKLVPYAVAGLVAAAVGAEYTWICMTGSL